MEDSMISTTEAGLVEAAQPTQNLKGEIGHLIVWQVSNS